MKHFYLVLSLIVSSVSVFGQADGDYRSVGGDWSMASSWERFDGGTTTWLPAVTPPTTTDGFINITAFTTVDVTTTVNADQITVEGDATLNVQSGGRLVVFNGAGDDLTVTVGDGFFTNDGFLNVLPGGILENRGLIQSSSTNLTITGSSSLVVGTLIHNQNGGTIPLALWDTFSLLEIQGITNAAPGGFAGQTFYDLRWNSSGQTAGVSLAGNLTNINHDLEIRNTNTGSLALSTNNSGTLSIGHDLLITNTGAFAVTQTGTFTVNVTNDVTVSSTRPSCFLLAGAAGGIGGTGVVNAINFTKSAAGGVTMVSTAASAGTATGTLHLTGNFTWGAGTLTMAAGTTATATGTISFDGSGNIAINGGTVTETSTPVASGGKFLINSGTHSYSNAGAMTQTISFQINNLGTLNILGNNVISGSGALTVTGKLGVGSTDLNGAIQSALLAGNIQLTGARTYNSGCTVIYNGSAKQYVGDGQPVTAGVNTTISNSAGVDLIPTVPVIITTNLTISSGDLNIGDGTLTLGGTLNVTSPSKITITSGGSISISGTGNIGTFPFPSATQTFTNLTLDNPNGVTFATPVTINGTVTLTDGTVSFTGTTLTLGGTFAASGGGDLSLSSSSTLIVNGSGAFGTLRINPTNNTVGTFTFARSGSGTATLGGTLIVNTTFNLNNGTLTTVGLQMANGSTIVRNSNGSLSGSAPTASSGRYNVSYTGGTLTTGLELPTTVADYLQNLTINTDVTLDKNINVHGTVLLSGSSLDASSFGITLSGNPGAWTKGNGTFTPGTGTVTIASGANVTISSTNGIPRMGNLTSASGATLTVPSGDFNILGNLNINGGSTFNHNNGRIVMNGSGAQNLSGGGKTFNNLSINKSGGAVTLLTAVNLQGLLDFQTANSVAANGFLTLLSSASGTASIGDLSIFGTPSNAVIGSVTAQRYMAAAGRNYRDISSPVQSATVQMLINSNITITGPFTGSSYNTAHSPDNTTPPCGGCSTNGPSMFYYDESVAGALTNGYVGYPLSGGNTSATLTTGKGYNVLFRTQLSPASPTAALSGTINAGTIALPITFTNSGSPADDGWNFIGNPYPSSVDWNSGGFSLTNYPSNTISVWDPTKPPSGGYRTNGVDLPGDLIAAGQGFWIHGISGTAISISESAKTSSTAGFLRVKTPVKDVLMISLNWLDSAGEDFATLELNQKARLDYDDFDGVKLPGPRFNLSTLSKDGIPLVVNRFDAIPKDDERIYLKMSDIGTGNFKVGIQGSGAFDGQKVILHDQLTGDAVDITREPYTFTVTESNQPNTVNRFYLVFGGTSITGVIDAERQVVLYPNPTSGKLNVEVNSTDAPEGNLIDGMGKELGSLSWMQGGSNKWTSSYDMTSYSTGIYFVRVKKSDGVHMVKFIKN